MKIRNLGLLTLTAGAVLSLAACSSGAPAAGGGAPEGLIKIRVQSQASIAAEPLYMGIERGVFEEEGLDVEVVDLPDLPAAVAALQAGRLDLAFVPAISALTMAHQNVPITLVAAADGINPASAEAPPEEKRNYTSVGVYVSKGSGIESIEDLAGASIAVTELKGQPDGTITSVLQGSGVKTDGIEWLKLGYQPALDGLKADQIDAAMLVSPFSLEADKAGLKRIMNPTIEFFPPGFATTSWAGNSSWVAENTEAVKRFQRAMAKANQWANENADQVKQHAIDRAGLKLTVADMPKSYWPASGTVDAEQLREVDEKLVAIQFYPEPVDITKILAAPAQ